MPAMHSMSHQHPGFCGQVTKVLSSPLRRAMYTAKAVQTFQTLAGHKPPQALQREELTNRDWGEWDGQPASEVASGPEANPPTTICPCRACCCWRSAGGGSGFLGGHEGGALTDPSCCSARGFLWDGCW